jgi:hypothetical protein
MPEPNAQPNPGAATDAPRLCPFCRRGTMITLRVLDPQFQLSPFEDSS